VVVSENIGLGRLFGPTRQEVIGGWRKLRSKELHRLPSSPHIIRVESKKDEMCGACRTRGKDEFIKIF
jgi:hypothetical protein